MQRQLPIASRARVARPTPASGGRVPQEHIRTPDSDAAPRDWSQLGRRVLAEAWYRLTDEHGPGRGIAATPVVPAPHDKEQP
jgi:hypothetical protein